MRNHFSFGELGGIIEATKRPDIVKIASGTDDSNSDAAEAMEAVCRIADTLDELGHADMADELVKSTQALLRDALIKKAEVEDKGNEEDKGDEKQEVIPVTCPHCSKSFDLVVECEDDECEVEPAAEGTPETYNDDEVEGQEDVG